MRGSRRGTGGPDPAPAEKSQKIIFPRNTGPVSLKNQTSIQCWAISGPPAVNVGPSSARQRNAISMAFRWRADNGPLLVVFGSSPPPPPPPKKKKKKKKKNVEVELDPRLLHRPRTCILIVDCGAV